MIAQFGTKAAVRPQIGAIFPEMLLCHGIMPTNFSEGVMGVVKSAEVGSFPTISFRIFEIVIQDLSQDLTRLRSFPDSIPVAGSTRYQLLGSLRAFGMLTSDHQPTSMLIALAEAWSTDYPVVLDQAIVATYGSVNELDLSTASVRDLDEALIAGGCTESALLKARRFFIRGCLAAHRPLSENLLRAHRIPTPATLLDRRPSLVAKVSPRRRDGITVAHLARRFPEFDPRWPETLQLAWFETFKQLLAKTSKYP